MDIKDFYLAKKYQIILMIFLSSLLISSCNLREYIRNNGYSDEIKSSEGITDEVYTDKTNSECSYISLSPDSLFGVWHLERIAFTKFIVELEMPEYVYLSPVYIENFLGYELEFNYEFVRLGDRRLYEPEYIIHLSAEGWLFFNEMNLWEAGYYASPQDLIDSFREEGLCIGQMREGSIYPHFVEVFIRYPNPMFWHGVHTDPDPELMSEFNPLFQSVVILNNDYILVGSGEMILARRIQGSNSE